MKHLDVLDWVRRVLLPHEILRKLSILQRMEQVTRTQQSRQFSLIQQKLESFDMKFSEYQTKVNQTLASILDLVASESIEIQEAIALASDRSSDSAEIQAAFDQLDEKRQMVGDAIRGLISTVPSPTEPTPIETPVIVDPVVPPAVDPEVPVEVTPSPDGVGVDQGIEVIG